MKKVRQMIVLAMVFVVWCVLGFGFTYIRPLLAGPIDLGADALARQQEYARMPTQEVRIGKSILLSYADGSLEITAPIIMSASTSGSPSYGLICTTNGDLVTYLDHASPRPPDAVIKQRIADAVSRKDSARRKAKDEISGQLQQRVENLERLLDLRQ